MNKFFSYDVDSGFAFHETAECAKAEALVMLKIERDAAQHDGEWSEAVAEICWGEIREAAAPVGDDYELKEG